MSPRVYAGLDRAPRMLSVSAQLIHIGGGVGRSIGATAHGPPVREARTPARRVRPSAWVVCKPELE